MKLSILKILFPNQIKIFYNQMKNKNKYDVKFGKNAKAMFTVFEGKNIMNENTSIRDSYVGFGSYISGDCNLSKVKFGKFCSIGQDVENRFSLHPSREFVSTHPAFYSLKKQAGFTFVKINHFQENKFVDETNKYLCEIGNDVWIGSHVKIMNGIRIGNGAIVATGAVVVKDVNPYEIVGGVPASHIRFRFKENQIKFLQDLKWWDWNFEYLQEKSYLFTNIDDLMSMYFKKLNNL